ncbi:MAG: hypothetical protein U9O78_04925 [Patescibacteria group bacterium]|nr:hypothetical protein [Patescibacteria group bacterium]
MTNFKNHLLAAVDPGGGGSGGGGSLNLNIREKATEAELPYADQVTGDEPGKAAASYILSNLLEAAMLIAGLALLLYLIWGAIEWITSGGDTSKLEKARNRITQAVVGIIVLSAVIAVFKLVQEFLGVTLIDFV